jgi:hypothetical protein
VAGFFNALLAITGWVALGVGCGGALIGFALWITRGRSERASWKAGRGEADAIADPLGTHSHSDTFAPDVGTPL